MNWNAERDGWSPGSIAVDWERVEKEKDSGGYVAYHMIRRVNMYGYFSVSVSACPFALESISPLITRM